MGKSVVSSEYLEGLALFEKAVAAVPGIERKGDTMPYTSLNGHMFSLFTKEGTLALRLSEPDRLAFVAKYKTEPVVQYGAVLKEYVAVPPTLLARMKELAKYFTASVEYIRSLKPKATAKPKRKK